MPGSPAVNGTPHGNDTSSTIAGAGQVPDSAATHVAEGVAALATAKTANTCSVGMAPESGLTDHAGTVIGRVSPYANPRRRPLHPSGTALTGGVRHAKLGGLRRKVTATWGSNMSSATLVSTSYVKQALKNARLLATAAAILTTAPICAYAEELSLDCDIVSTGGYRYKAHIEADNYGVSIKQDNGASAYTTNKDDHSEWFRVTPTEIVFGFFLFSPRSREEITINRENAAFRDSRYFPSQPVEVVETGTCRKAAPVQRRF
jgi:hypothetical protein